MRAFLLLTGLVVAPRSAQPPAPADSRFGTFSIIASDPAVEELGIGLESRAFGADAHATTSSSSTILSTVEVVNATVAACDSTVERSVDAGVDDPIFENSRNGDPDQNCTLRSANETPPRAISFGNPHGRKGACPISAM